MAAHAMETTPHAAVITGSHVLGPRRVSARLEGTCAGGVRLRGEGSSIIIKQHAFIHLMTTITTRIADATGTTGSVNSDKPFPAVGTLHLQQRVRQRERSGTKAKDARVKPGKAAQLQRSKAQRRPGRGSGAVEVCSVCAMPGVAKNTHKTPG